MLPQHRSSDNIMKGVPEPFNIRAVAWAISGFRYDAEQPAK
jgi:hypothetical protein